MAAGVFRKTTRLSAAVTAVRAGLIPTSDHFAEEANARLGHAASLIQRMRRIAESSRRASEQAVITDILADLQYYCEVKGHCFEEVSRASEADNEEWQRAR